MCWPAVSRGPAVAAQHRLDTRNPAGRIAPRRRSARATTKPTSRLEPDRHTAELGVRSAPSGTRRLVSRDLRAWLRRLESAGRSQSTIDAYRIAIGSLLAWAEATQRTTELFEEGAIVDYLDDYRRQSSPAPATYHRRFVLLRRFMRWFSRRNGTPDPFLELQAPPKPHQVSDWLTHEEFTALLAGAGRPQRNRPGLAARDRLVLIALVVTALRRAELMAVDWRDVTLDGPRPSLAVKRSRSRAGGPVPTAAAVESL